MSALRKGVFGLAAAAALSACGTVDRVAVRSTTDVLVRGRASVFDEPDYDLAKDAAPSQLKLIEALLSSTPQDRDLRRLAAEGFGGGAFLFYEDAAPQRAKGFYLRGRDHALAALALKPAFRALADKPLDEFAKTLAAATKDDVPDLFWAGFGWAGAINLSKDDASALADLPKATALMQRVLDLEPSFHDAGADLYFGVYYASRPPLLGGDPQKALKHFAAAQKLTQDEYLLAPVLEARWYAVAVQDKDLFKQLLTKAVEAPSGRRPETRLIDEAAKRKAAALLEKIDDYF